MVYLRNFEPAVPCSIQVKHTHFTFTIFHNKELSKSTVNFKG